MLCFASTALAAELHRQHGYRVRFNDNSQYPQILEIVEEVPLPKPDMKHVCVGLALFWQLDHWGLGAAANSIPLPEAKPRAVGELLVMPPISSREVACAERPNIRRFEHFL
jgi:hypothetical protein